MIKVETMDFDSVDENKQIKLRCDFSGRVIFLLESEYDTFVTELEAKARELWPHKFEAYKLPDPKFVPKDTEIIGGKVYKLKDFDDGSRAWVEQTLELNDVIKLDKELRQQQIPLNSKKP